jgi:hypothetical protein
MAVRPGEAAFIGVETHEPARNGEQIRGFLNYPPVIEDRLASLVITDAY